MWEPAIGAGTGAPKAEAHGIARGQRNLCPDRLRRPNERGWRLAGWEPSLLFPGFTLTSAALLVLEGSVRGLVTTWNQLPRHTGILTICSGWPTRVEVWLIKPRPVPRSVKRGAMSPKRLVSSQAPGSTDSPGCLPCKRLPPRLAPVVAEAPCSHRPSQTGVGG